MPSGGYGADCGDGWALAVLGSAGEADCPRDERGEPPGGAARKRRRSDSSPDARDRAACRRPSPHVAEGRQCAPTLDESFSNLHTAYDQLSQAVKGELFNFKNYEVQVRRELHIGREELRERAAKLDRLQHRLNLFTTSSSDGRSPGDKPVIINVGGRCFTTTLGTLCAVPDTLFSVMLAGDWQVERDADGAIWIDRDPEFFNFILSYLRDRREGRGTFSLKGLSKADAARLADEAEFFGVEPLKRLAINCTALVVSHEIDAPYGSVGAALADARNGDRIVVFPGTYFESIRTDKRVEICGEGPREKIVLVTTEDAPTYTFGGNGGGVLRNLSLREMSRYGTCTVEVTDHASVLVENCNLTTRQNANAVNVVDHASLTIRDCRIHDVKGSAVFLRDDATATIQCNVMRDLGSCGVFVRHRSRFYIRENTIQHAALGGIDVNDNATGTIESNVIENCRRAGIALYGHSHTQLKTNTITQCEYGMRSFENSQVVIKNNKLSGNEVANLQGSALRRADEEERTRK